MNRFEVDGVPVFWKEGNLYTAVLLFAVGRRDETFVSGGITHLIEHLAMSSLPKSHLDCNASVSESFTSFTATGRPEAVGDFISRIAQILGDLPLDRLDVEASILDVEGSGTSHPTAATLLARRFGMQNLGLTLFAEPAIDAITEDAVRDHLSKFFVADNAAVWFSGPPPADLTLGLPAGARNELVRPAPLSLKLPVAFESPQPGVGISFVGPLSEPLLG